MIESIPLTIGPSPPKATPNTRRPGGTAAHRGTRPRQIVNAIDATQAGPSDLDSAQVRQRSPRSNKMNETIIRPVLTDLLARRPELRVVVFTDTLDALVR